jgi:hypothetical protein
MKSDWEMKSD